MVYLTVRTGYTFFIEGIPMKKSDRKRRPAADKPVRDIYQEVTDRIVETRWKKAPVRGNDHGGRRKGQAPVFR